MKKTILVIGIKQRYETCCPQLLKAVLICCMLSMSQLLFAQTAATVTVDCADAKGVLLRTEKYNNVSGKYTGAATRDTDYAFMNTSGLHAKILRVWVNETDIYNKTTGVYDYSAYTDYFNDVSGILADTILINIIGKNIIESWDYTPAQCKPIIKNIIKYFKTNYSKVKYIEALNEPDLYGGTIMNSSVVYSYYKIFYEAVNEVNAELSPAIPLKVGGPALASFKYAGYEWLTAMMDGYAADTSPNKKLDFLSFHTYSYKAAPKELDAVRGQIDNWLNARGLSTGIPTYITEVGVFPGADTSGTAGKDALVQAAGMASCQYWILNSSKHVPFNWVMRHADHVRKDQIVTRPASYSDRLTPYGNMMKMMGMMKTNRVAASSNVMDADGLGMYGLAATDATGVSIMAWNYRHTGTLDYNVAVNISNLPAIFNGKNIRKKIYKIDQTTSNNFYDINNCNLQLISDVEVLNTGAALTVALGTMHENSLQLVMLTPGTTAVNTPYGGTVRNIPGKIEAEHYDHGGQGIAYNDLTAGNSGNELRTDNVDLTATTDAGGGYNAGYIQTGEWLEYSVNILTPGTYNLTARVAATAAGKTFHMEMDGINVSGTITVPNTGSFQTYQDVTVTTSTMTAGQKIMRIVMDASDFNLNYLNFTARQTPFNGTVAVIPGKVSAENYDVGGFGIAYNDNTTGNAYAVYRTDDVDIQDCTDGGGGYNVANIVAGEWLEYTVNITTAGTYTLLARVAAVASGKTFHVEINGVNVSGTVTVPNTGGYQTWQNVSVTTTALTTGQKIMRVVMDAGGFNLNYMTFTSTGGSRIAAGVTQPVFFEAGVARLSPNPAVNSIQVKTYLFAAAYVNVEVQDMQGRSLLQKDFGIRNGNFAERIDISRLPKGAYLLRLRQGNSMESIKFLKQ